MSFTFNKTSQPDIEDDEYVYDLNPNFTIQVSHYEGETAYVINEHGDTGEDDGFWAKDHGETKDLEAAKRRVVALAGIEYALLRPLSPEGALTTMDDNSKVWEVSIAAPRADSTTERDQSDIFTTEDTEEAVAHLLSLMDQGLVTVIDSPNLRLFDIMTPDSLGDALTDAVSDACDEIDAEDARDDDWDSTEFSELRDAVMDALDARNDPQEKPDGPDL